jgi:hypothetical protein
MVAMKSGSGTAGMAGNGIAVLAHATGRSRQRPNAMLHAAADGVR